MNYILKSYCLKLDYTLLVAGSLKYSFVGIELLKLNMPVHFAST